MQRGDKSYWVCVKHEGEHCRGRCKSENGIVEVTNGKHNHVLDPSYVDVQRRLATMKSLATTTQDLPCEIITRTVSNASVTVAASLPSPALLTRTINKTRKINSAAPANPASLADVEIDRKSVV